MLNNIEFYEYEKEPKFEKDKIKDFGTTFLKCTSCDEDIAVIKVMRQTSEVKDYQAKCSCGGLSFIKNIVGSVYTDAAPKYNLIDIEYSYDGKPVIIKVNKNDQ